MRNKARGVKGAEKPGNSGTSEAGESTVQSVDRAVTILELLAQHGALGVTRLAGELGVHKSTARRLVAALERLVRFGDDDARAAQDGHERGVARQLEALLLVCRGQWPVVFRRLQAVLICLGL